MRIVVEDLLEAADIVLTAPLEPEHTGAEQPSGDAGRWAGARDGHPHRRAPVRAERARRRGTVAPRPAACVSPVRPATAAGTAGRRSRRPAGRA